MMRRVVVNSTGATRSAAQVRLQAAVPPRRSLYKYDSFLAGTSSAYIEGMYHQWKADPSSVDGSWVEVFERAELADLEKPLLNEERRPRVEVEGVTGSGISQSLADCTRLTWLIQAFEDRGHLLASLDPLEDRRAVEERTPIRKYSDNLRLDLEYFGFTTADYNRQVHVGFMKHLGGLLSEDTLPLTIKALHDRLTKTYCGNVGYEFTHISNEAESRWLRDHIEGSHAQPNSPLQYNFNNEEKKEMLKVVSQAVLFEDLLHRKYSTKKRFGLDGGESLVLGLEALLSDASRHGVTEAICGMAHRGRLSCLTHIFGKPLEAILKEFRGVKEEEMAPFRIQADVKYHLGSRATRTFGNGPEITVELLSNPSHLEAVNPLVQGKTKASQVAQNDAHGEKVLPIEIHGDAAFSGQGIAFETMGLSEIGKYHTGGTVHIVTNNQIGFTTDPKSSRSSAYCTDLGRVFHCPIFHVNGDRPEDVARVFRMAAAYRKEFHKSVVVDLVCYRRNGHNESDVPSLTQPLLYKRIDAHPDIMTLYGNKLISEKVITQDEFNELKRRIKAPLNDAFDRVGKGEFNYGEYMKNSVQQESFALSDGTPAMEATAVSNAALEPVINCLNNSIPEGFAVHPTLEKILARRKESLLSGDGIEWGVAEALAFGTLVEEGYHVHVSGQDVERATFSQRHAVLHDQKTNATHTQLEHVSKTQANFTIVNSSLSEYGVLGFETGYSLQTPKSLCMWEAQFGDFANGAQIIFDQFLSSGETKWNLQYAPIVSMPHGYDGMGPEHSSGRIERFLQQVAEAEDTPALSEEERHHRVNMEITFPTTPAQYFHLLRRHVKRNFRKPLINFFSKGFLRGVKGCNNTSTLSEFTGFSKFMALIGDPEVPADKCRRVVLCCGQVYHKLYLARAAAGVTDVALVRIEQIAPFPVAEVQKVLEEYPTQELVYCQEEPQNMGAFWHVEARIEQYTAGKRELKFAGRPPSASPSTGFKYAHDYEHDLIMKAALH